MARAHQHVHRVLHRHALGLRGGGAAEALLEGRRRRDGRGGQAADGRVLARKARVATAAAYGIVVGLGLCTLLDAIRILRARWARWLRHLEVALLVPRARTAPLA